jgi:hypothetical protein
MTEPKKPISNRQDENLEEKEAPRRLSVFGEEADMKVDGLEPKEAPRRMSLAEAEAGEVGGHGGWERIHDLEEKEAPRRMSIAHSDAEAEIEPDSGDVGEEPGVTDLDE